jgi:hypothetical protein
MAQAEFEPELRTIFSFDKNSNRGRADVYLIGHTPFAVHYAYNRGVHSKPVASCLFSLAAPGSLPPSLGGTGVVTYATSSRRDVYMYVEKLQNNATMNKGNHLAPQPSWKEQRLISRLGQRLLCSVIHKLVAANLLGRNSILTLSRGPDMFDKDLERYYNFIGFEEYDLERDTLFPTREYDKAMETPISYFLALCNSGSSLASNLRKKRMKKARKPARVRNPASKRSAR